MRAINHALTGAIIGLAIENPAIAVSAAVLSHYVCDVIPHFGANLPGNTELKSGRFRNLLYIDALLCALLVLTLALMRPHHWLVAAVSAFAASAPDFLSVTKYVQIRRGKAWKAGWYNRFAHGIQWFERPIGAVVEVAWLVAALVIIAPFVS